MCLESFLSQWESRVLSWNFNKWQNSCSQTNMDRKLNVSEISHSSSHTSDVTSCSFSKVGIFATSSSDHTVRLWSLVNTGLKEIAVLRGHKYGVNYCQFSPQGTLLASASTDSTTIIWDVKTQENLCSLVQPSGCGVRVCKFCPHSAFIATAGLFVWL